MNYPLYNDTLCPKVWAVSGNSYSMKPEIRNALMSIAKDFMSDVIDENDVSLSMKDVLIIGSMTNFNWTPYSDFDLHIIVDFSELDMSPEDAKVMADSLKSSWNKSHDITIKGFPVEIYLQDVSEKPETSSIYSVKDDDWVKRPEKKKPTFDKKYIQRKHRQFKEKLEDVLSNPDEDSLKTILDKIYNMRQAGLDKKGEFSEENIVFKILRAQGYLDKLKDVINSTYDKEHTIEEIGIRESVERI